MAGKRARFSEDTKPPPQTKKVYKPMVYEDDPPQQQQSSSSSSTTTTNHDESDFTTDPKHILMMKNKEKKQLLKKNAAGRFGGSKKRRNEGNDDDDNNDQDGDDTDSEADDDEPRKNMTVDKSEESSNTNLSLSADPDEEGKIMPFNLNEERYGGGGYFDQDSGGYVFRRERGEEDAWLNSLGGEGAEEDFGKPKSKDKKDKKKKKKGKKGDNDSENEAPSESDDSENDEDDEEEDEEDYNPTMTDRTKLSLYQSLLSLLSSGETVLTGLKRLGLLTKRNPVKKPKTNAPQAPIDTTALANATSKFNILTESSSLLLNAGETDVYQMTYEELNREMKECKANADSVDDEAKVTREKRSVFDDVGMKDEGRADASGEVVKGEGDVSWQYKGLDGNLHGPFTSQQMLEWRCNGYFGGEQAVSIRIVGCDSNEKEKVEEEVVEMEDGNDLMDDLENDLNSDDEAEKVEEKEEIVAAKDGGEGGEQWQKSDEVNFAKYC